MTYGLKIYNAAGDILIDGESRTMLLWHETEVSLTTTMPSKGAETDVSYGGLSNKPLVLLSPITDLTRFEFRPWKSGSLWDRVRIRKSPYPIGTHNVKVFIFSQGEGLSNETYGLRIRSSSGELLIDSGRRMARKFLYFSGILSGSSIVTHGFGENLGYIPPVGFKTRETNWEVDSTCGSVHLADVSLKVSTDRIEVRNYTYAIHGPASKYIIPKSIGSVNYGIYVFKDR